MARQNFLHTIRFVKWLLINRKWSESEVQELTECLDTRAQQMYEIDKVLFFDVIHKVPNLKEVYQWQNKSRIANMLCFNKIQQPFSCGFYKLSVGKKIPTFTFIPKGGTEIFQRLIVRATITKSVSELKLKLSII